MYFHCTFKPSKQKPGCRIKQLIPVCNSNSITSILLDSDSSQTDSDFTIFILPDSASTQTHSDSTAFILPDSNCDYGTGVKHYSNSRIETALCFTLRVDPPYCVSRRRCFLARTSVERSRGAEGNHSEALPSCRHRWGS